MLKKILIYVFILSRTTRAQINGDFWWLSDKVAKLTGKAPSAPKFEELSEFDTDESAKIIFRDPLFLPDDRFESAKSDDSYDYGDIVWPDDKTFIKKPEKSHSNDKPNSFTFGLDQDPNKSTQKDINNPTEDSFVFKFPEDDNSMKKPLKYELSDLSTSPNIISNSIAKPTSKDDSKEDPTTEYLIIYKKNESREDLFSFQFPKNDNLLWTHTNTTDSTKEVSKETEQINVNENLLNDETSSYDVKPNSNSESICSFMKKKDCYKMNGVIYNQNKFREDVIVTEKSIVCCILPIPTESSKIYFPDSPEFKSRRFRRSSKPESPNTKPLAQRDFLLRQKFRPEHVKPTASHTRVVTPTYDDYVDPYWNIKSSNLKKPTRGSQKQDCDDPDYVEDYVVELPKPGLVGLYSDNPPRPSWSYDSPKPSYGGAIEYSDEDDGNTFGYSTVDPRRSTSKAPKRGRPVKLTTSSPEDTTYDQESQTVSFPSSPNFQVLQGFKLPNLTRNRHKFYTKNTRRSTTEGSIENDSKEPVKADSGVADDSRQVFKSCGQTAVQIDTGRKDKQFGEAASGSHPWMALAVLTQKPQGILCYATIVHPRAAVTAGDCVYGRTAVKEVTLVAGLWDINDRSRSQNRFVTATLHPQHRPKILAHNLALLHWKTPLRLNGNVQPACLGSSHTGDDCMFFGWGGFDQGVRSKPRWQRASILPEQDCSARLSKSLDLPDDGFCATVTSRGTVTGIGGPLICNVYGQKTASGVSVWRDDALVLIPAHEWIVRAFDDLGIE